MTDIENKIREAWNRAGISKPLNESLWEVAVAYNGPEYLFRKGYLDAHQEAAAQIEEKEKEIENFEGLYFEAQNKLRVAVDQLTAAREREEKAVEVVEACRSHDQESIRQSTAMVWDASKRKPLVKRLEAALAAYDVSRTEKKESNP